MPLVPASDEGLEHLSAVFRLLGDKTRLNIVFLLAEGQRNVGDLCDALALPQSTVSHHLGLLRINHLIANRRNGKQIYYTLSGSIGIDAAHGMFIDTGLFHVAIGESDSARAATHAHA